MNNRNGVILSCIFIGVLIMIISSIALYQSSPTSGYILVTPTPTMTPGPLPTRDLGRNIEFTTIDGMVCIIWNNRGITCDWQNWNPNSSTIPHIFTTPFPGIEK